MTADKSMETTGQDQEQGARKSGGRKTGRKASARGGAAKRKTAASRRTATSRSSRTDSADSKSRSGSSSSARGRSRSGRKSGGSSSSSSGIASRFLSRGRKAAGNAYEWAAEGASRAIPLASRSMPDQRMVQRLVDERPYMLGALGLGIGAMIGLMLPSPLSSRGGSPSRSSGRGRKQS